MQLIIFTPMATFFPEGANSFMGALAFDMGGVSTRCGFAGDAEPRATFPSTVLLGFPAGVAEHESSEGECEGYAYATRGERRPTISTTVSYIKVAHGVDVELRHRHLEL